MTDRLVGLMADHMDGRSANLMVDHSACRSTGHMAGQMVDQRLGLTCPLITWQNRLLIT